MLARFEAFSRREFPGLDTLTEASVQAWIAAARRRAVKPATAAGPGRAGPGAGPLAGPARRDGLPAARGRAAQARPVRPAHLHRRELAALFAQTDRCHYCAGGSAAAPGHAGAVPHDLRLRAALLGGPAAARRRRRHRHRRAADPRRERRQGPAGARLRPTARAGSPATTPRSPDSRTAGVVLPRQQARPAADARQRRPQLPPVPLAGAHLPRRTAGTAPECTIYATRWRSTTCGPGSPQGATSARCCRCCKPTWAIRRIADTAYYLHLTAESYPDITARVQQVIGDVVPPVTAGPLMATDFAVFLRRFLTGHLAGLRGYSPNTIASYRDAFKLLICYFRDERSRPAGASSPSSMIDAAADHRVPRLAAHQPAQHRVDQQPAAGRDRLVLHLDANPGPGPHGVLPGHPRDPREQTRPAGRGPPDRRADPAAARPARPVHPHTADATRPCWPPSTTPPPGSKNSPT